MTRVFLFNPCNNFDEGWWTIIWTKLICIDQISHYVPSNKVPETKSHPQTCVPSFLFRRINTFFGVVRAKVLHGDPPQTLKAPLRPGNFHQSQESPQNAGKNVPPKFFTWHIAPWKLMIGRRSGFLFGGLWPIFFLGSDVFFWSNFRFFLGWRRFLVKISGVYKVGANFGHQKPPTGEVYGFNPCGGGTFVRQGRDRTDLLLWMGVYLGVPWFNG